MNLVQLKYFSEVAAARSFTRAAGELGIAQPALSRQIKLLEQELGVALLLRHGRGVELTEAGALLQQRAEFLLRSVDQTRVELISRAAVPTGTLAIGCPPSLARSLLIGPLTEFIGRFPEVRIQLEEGSSEGLLGGVLADQLDFAILTTAEPQPNLSIQPLFDEPIWLFAPPDHCPPGMMIDLAEVARLPIVVARRPHGVRVALDRAMAEAGLRPNIVLETNAWQVIRDLILRRVGFFISSRSAQEAEVRDGTLSGGPIGELRIARGLIRRTDRPMRRAVQEFLLLLEAEVARYQP